MVYLRWVADVLDIVAGIVAWLWGSMFCKGPKLRDAIVAGSKNGICASVRFWLSGTGMSCTTVTKVCDATAISGRTKPAPTANTLWDSPPSASGRAVFINLAVISLGGAFGNR